MLLLNKFCFFLSLSTGAVIIGIINTTYGFLQAYLEIYMALQIYSISASAPIKSRVEVLYASDTLPTMQLLFGIYLIYGSIKEKPSVLYASIILHLAFVVHSICFIFFALYEIEVHSAHFIDVQLLDEALKIPVMSYFAFMIYNRLEEISFSSTAPREPILRRMIEESSEDVRLA